MPPSQLQLGMDYPRAETISFKKDQKWSGFHRDVCANNTLIQTESFYQSANNENVAIKKQLAAREDELRHLRERFTDAVDEVHHAHDQVRRAEVELKRVRAEADDLHDFVSEAVYLKHQYGDASRQLSRMEDKLQQRMVHSLALEVCLLPLESRQGGGPQLIDELRVGAVNQSIKVQWRWKDLCPRKQMSSRQAMANGRTHGQTNFFHCGPKLKRSKNTFLSFGRIDNVAAINRNDFLFGVGLFLPLHF